MTHRSTQIRFSGILSIPVVVDFNGDNLTSDAGVLFVRQLDERLCLSARLAAWNLVRQCKNPGCLALFTSRESVISVIENSQDGEIVNELASPISALSVDSRLISWYWRLGRLLDSFCQLHEGNVGEIVAREKFYNGCNQT